MSDNANPAILDKKLLQKTKALFSFVKSKISLSRTPNETPRSS